MTIPISELELSVRTSNVLRAQGVETVAQLMELTRDQMLSWRGMGRKSVREVLEIQRELKGPDRDDRWAQFCEAVRTLNAMMARDPDFLMVLAPDHTVTPARLSRESVGYLRGAG